MNLFLFQGADKSKTLNTADYAEKFHNAGF
jgi:hypothetical protein